MSGVLKPMDQYIVNGSISHIGFSADSGHYSSFIRFAPDTWYITQTCTDVDIGP